MGVDASWRWTSYSMKVQVTFASKSTWSCTTFTLCDTMTFPSASNFAVHTLQSRLYDARPRWLHKDSSNNYLWARRSWLHQTKQHVGIDSKWKYSNLWWPSPCFHVTIHCQCACSKQFCPPRLCVEKSVQHANHCKQRVPHLPATGLIEFKILLSKPQICLVILGRVLSYSQKTLHTSKSHWKTISQPICSVG